jgi:hypothetical protein
VRHYSLYGYLRATAAIGRKSDGANSSSTTGGRNFISPGEFVRQTLRER